MSELRTSNFLDSYGLVEPHKEDNKSKNSIVPKQDDGSLEIDETYGGPSPFGQSVHYDAKFSDQKSRIDFYREMECNSYVDNAIQEIVNEAINEDPESGIAAINLEKTPLSDTIKKKIQEEFENVLQLFNFDYDAHDLFRKFYVDGQLNFFKVVDKDEPGLGVIELREIDARYIRKVSHVKRDIRSQREVEREEYYIYTDPKLDKRDKGVRLNKDSVARSWSGRTNKNNEIISYLDKAIVPYNQVNDIEVAVLIYFISRAPERLVFYVDTGMLPRHKADAHVRSVARKYQNKQVYDIESGKVSDKKKIATMLENYWLPRQEGSRGTEVSQVGGSVQLSQQIEIIDWFKNKLYKALNVPLSRLQRDGMSIDFGRASEITRDEVNFVKFIRRVQNRFSQMLIDVLRSQIVLKNILTRDEWDELAYNIKVDFAVDSIYEESKNLEILEGRLRLLRDADEYVRKTGGYFSPNWVKRNILNQSEQEIEDIKKEIDQAVKDGEIAEDDGPGF